MPLLLTHHHGVLCPIKAFLPKLPMKMKHLKDKQALVVTLADRCRLLDVS